MLFQTLLQNLLSRKRAKKPAPAKDLSPMAESIMQKLAEHDKNQVSDQNATIHADNVANKPLSKPPTQ
jgi:hypothetical protein